MPNPSLGRARLVAQGLITAPYERPADALSAFVAMQGQDLPGVLASAALRTRTGEVAEVLADLDAGLIVRGYPMRGTVFLMSGADAPWVTELCAAPALRAASSRRHQLDLTDADVQRAGEAAAEALAAGPLSRADLMAVWEADGMSTGGGRGYHVLSALIGQTLLCYGPWNGVDQDVVLTAEWLPQAHRLADRFDGERVPAVAELLRRYLSAHGPATLRDFAWWTKLTLTEIRRALPSVVGSLESDGADEASYWRPGLMDEVAALGRAVDAPLLLPGFDEYILGYQDRLFAATPDHHARLVPGNNGVFRRTAIVSATVRGTWARAGRPGRRSLEIEEFVPIAAAARRRLEARFARFPFVAD